MLPKTVQIGNPIIRKISKKVKINSLGSQEVKDTISNLTKSMRKNQLVGMAAPQIGTNLEIFVTELRETKFRKNLKGIDPLRVYINPEIISYSKEQTILYEGCGSLANAQLFGPVKRPKKISIKALDAKGKEFTLSASGLLAKVIQHEHDHLKGVVCIDKFTDTKKVMERGEYIKNS